MHTPIQAMLWELSRLGRIEFLLRIVAMCFFIIAVYLLARDLSEFHNQLARQIALVMIIIPAPFSQVWLNQLDSHSKGFCFRLNFIRPISTVTLVLVPLLFSLVTSIGCYVIPAIVASYLWNTWLPLLGPSLLIAFVVQSTFAVVWSLTGRVSKFIGICILAAVFMGMMFFVFRGQDPILITISRPSFYAMNWMQYLCLFSTMCVTTIATVVAVDRQRHGDGWESKAGMRIRSLKSSPMALGAPFQSVLAAQCWYEWRQFGNRVLLCGVLAPMLVIAYLLLSTFLYSERTPNIIIWSIVLVCSPICFQLIAVDGAVGLKHVHGTTRLSLFDATRSLSNDQIIFVKLLVIAICSLIAWLFMVSVAWIDIFLIGHMEGGGTNSISIAIAEAVFKKLTHMEVAEWLVGLCNVFLLFFSSSSGLLALGLWLSIYRMRLVMLSACISVQCLLIVLALKYGWHIQYALNAYGYLLAGLILYLCVLSIRNALELGAIRERYLMAFCGVWIVFVVSTVVNTCKVAAQLPFTTPTAAIVLGSALLLVPLATTAIAPLAFATHRNG